MVLIRVSFGFGFENELYMEMFFEQVTWVFPEDFDSDDDAWDDLDHDEPEEGIRNPICECGKCRRFYAGRT
ncbi:hypothetical protein H2200_000130 [Cladophialophora chaetospira]|uniref:Uncharacterized protein n=1 Tax=Cladophialophora chaetospira TaxID=386627 RepID=A0AA38XN02_9EURO|nr:hypothetical protein H2200_000130 [Cladophialophora chaetospira]